VRSTSTRVHTRARLPECTHLCASTRRQLHTPICTRASPAPGSPRGPQLCPAPVLRGTDSFSAGWAAQEGQPAPHRALGSRRAPASTPSTRCRIERCPCTPGLQQPRPAARGHPWARSASCQARQAWGWPRVGTSSERLTSAGEKRLLALTTWLTSSPQLACRSSQRSEGLLESQGRAGWGVLILIMLKASQKNTKP